MTEARKPLSLDMITREFVHCFRQQWKLAPLVLSPSLIQDMRHSFVELNITDKDLLLTLDDLAEKILIPAANGLVKRLEDRGANTCYNLPLVHSAIDCTVARYDGVSMRGTKMLKLQSDKVAYYFEILYS